jgi:hypothetical protein
MKKYSLLLVFFTFSSLFAQTKRDFTELPVVWPDTTAFKTDSLIFKPITAGAFEKIRNRPVKKKVTPPAIIRDSMLIVTTKKSVFELPAAGGYENSWDYIAFLPELSAYLLSNCGEGACSAWLLDFETDKKMPVPSSYDSGLTGLLMSTTGKYMLIYSSYDGDDYINYYSHRSEFTIYAVGAHKDIEGLKVYRNFISKDWFVEEIVWDNDTTLVLKVYTENKTGNGDGLQYKYYKTVIK